MLLHCLLMHMSAMQLVFYQARGPGCELGLFTEAWWVNLDALVIEA
jgi:hypothetical protein